MYERIAHWASSSGSPDSVLFHQHGGQAILQLHRQEIAAVRAGAGDADLLRSRLFQRCTDQKVLQGALVALASAGPTAAGPDGYRARELLGEDQGWHLCRSLQRELRAGTYQPGPARPVEIPKPGKSGTRTIWVQNAVDRVVARAATAILSPWVDWRFSAYSFAFRPHRGVHDALVALQRILAEGEGCILAVGDIRKAFDVVPQEQCFTVAEQAFGDEVGKLVRTLCRTDSGIGLRQGSPIGPLLCNVYLDAKVDQPWARHYPETPLLRYADDLLFACRSAQAGAEQATFLAQLCTDARMPLKEMPVPGDLRQGQTLKWLGFRLQYRDQLEYGIDDFSWANLENQLSRCHETRQADQVALERARMVLHGWLAWMAPVYRFAPVRETLAHIREIGQRQGFAELPLDRELEGIWAAAAELWQQKLKAIRAKPTGAVLAQEPGDEPAPPPDLEALPWEQ